MSDYICFLILVLYDDRLLKCALRLKIEDMPGDSSEYPMEPENRKWIQSQLPENARNLGPIVDITELFVVEDTEKKVSEPEIKSEHPAWSKQQIDVEIMYYFSAVVSDVAVNMPDKLQPNEREEPLREYQMALAAAEWFIGAVGGKDQEDYWHQHGDFWGCIDSYGEKARKMLVETEDWSSFTDSRGWARTQELRRA